MSVTTIIVLGASGDLAKKKTFPALFDLYLAGLLPPRAALAAPSPKPGAGDASISAPALHLWGYARSAMTDAAFRAWLRPALVGDGSDASALDAARDAFLGLCRYQQGGYGDEAAMRALDGKLVADEVASGAAAANRLFYLAVPPTVFPEAAATVKRALVVGAGAGGAGAGARARGWSRVVVEKPFGRDSASSAALAAELAKHFDEAQVYRIDHYLGKEMVQNLMVLRFANAVFEPLWNAHHVSSVQITFKEPFGCEGRGGYFDEFGIIRDVMQNHLLQVFSLVAMEPPVSSSAEDVRDEKVKVLRCTAPLVMAETVVGQFGPSAAGDRAGYLQETGVPADSRTPTFAAAVLHVNNARWRGVPFILKCGKALNERKAEIRIQFVPAAAGIFGPAAAAAGAGAGAGAGTPAVGVGQQPISGTDAMVHSNELVIRIQPNEAVYLKLTCKVPGLEFTPVETELALSYKARYPERPPPEAYARLLLDVLRGDQSQFVRGDELAAAWAIFTPLLHALEAPGAPRPVVYPFGSRGPPAADMLIRRAGYRYSGGYYAGEWKRATEGPHAASAAAVLAAAERDWALPADRARAVLAAMLAEMRAGLASDADGASSIKMLPSFVTALPRGDEVGACWAVDMGGSNLRVVEVALRGGALSQRVPPGGARAIPDAVQKGPGAALFDFVAAAMVEAGVRPGAVVGFTFSYPTRQRALAAGELIEWTKGFAAPGVVGADVIKLLDDALGRAGAPGVRLAALVNDTVGTLMAAAYTRPDCRIGVILGTGSNAAYVERAAAITKTAAAAGAPPPAPGDVMVVNMEWGGFGSGADRTLLPFTAADDALDAHSINPGRQRYEKMLSGMYLGELVRLLLLELLAAGGLFVNDGHAAAHHTSPTRPAAAAAAATALTEAGKRAHGASLATPGIFETWLMSEFSMDESEDLATVGALLSKHLGIRHSSHNDRRVVKRVCDLVARRAARLAAVGVAACVTQMGAPQPVCAGIDGSVFKKHPRVRGWMGEALAELGVACDLIEADDGSGNGAAIIAAAATKGL